MKEKNILRELKKLGVPVVAVDLGNCVRMVARTSTGRVAEWFPPNQYANGEVSVRVRREDDQDDMRSDYHAGFFLRRVKDLEWALELTKGNPQPRPEDINGMTEEQKEDLMDDFNYVGSRCHY